MNNNFALIKVNNLIDQIFTKRFYDSIASKSLCESAIKLCEENHFERERGICLSLMGNIYSFFSKYDEAMEYLLNSISIFEKYDMLKEKSSAYIWMGNIYFDLNDYENAFDYYFKTLEIEKKLPDGKNEAGALNNIGEIYKYLKDYVKAKEYYFKSYTIDKSNDFITTKGSVLINLSDTYYILEDYNKALEFVEEAIVVSLKYKNYRSVPEAYKNLAQIQRKLKFQKEAKENYEKALEYSNQYEYYYLQIEVGLSYGDFLIEIGCYNEGIGLLLKVYDTSVNNGNLIMITDICYKLAQAYERVNKDEAYKYFKLFAEYEKKVEENRCKEISRSISIRNKLNLINKEKETLQVNNVKLNETIKNLAIIDELGQKIATTTDINRIGEYLLNTFEKFFKVDSFGIVLYDEKTNSITYDYFIDNGNQVYFPTVKLDSKNSFAAYCLRNNETIVINDLERDAKKYIQGEVIPVSIVNTAENVKSILYCPLVFNDMKIGVLTIQSYEKDFFTDYYIKVIKAISSYASIALINAMSLSELKKEIKFSEELNKKLNFLAENDELTGIPNRRSFLRNIEETWKKIKNTGKSISLILIDIDYFKEFNDNYGHVEGDTCIKFVAKILRDSLKEEYSVFRYGGDEFCIILPNTAKEQASLYAEIVRRRVTKAAYPHVFSKASDIVTISLGCATIIPDDSDSIRNLLMLADEALYNAKKQGRNRYMVS